MELCGGLGSGCSWGSCVLALACSEVFCWPSVLGSLLAGWFDWDLLVWLTEPFLAGGVTEFALDLLLAMLRVWECDWAMSLVDC